MCVYVYLHGTKVSHYKILVSRYIEGLFAYWSIPLHYFGEVGVVELMPVGLLIIGCLLSCE